MKACLKRIGYLAMLLGCMALLFGSTGCTTHGGWYPGALIFPAR